MDQLEDNHLYLAETLRLEQPSLADAVAPAEDDSVKLVDDTI